jgi:hypothetical protein
VSDLTAEEQKNVLTTLRFLRVRCGGAELLAKSLRVDRRTLNRPANASVAIRAARLAGVGVDDVLEGRFPPQGTCPHCGHVAKERA